MRSLPGCVRTSGAPTGLTRAELVEVRRSPFDGLRAHPAGSGRIQRAQGASSGSAHILGLANLVKWLRGRVEIPCALLPQFSLLAFDITERRWAAFAAGDRLAYALMGHGNQYEFYVRRYANTLTWTYKLVIRESCGCLP